MWHKRHRSQDPEAPPGQRLRQNLVDLYASGDVPGDRAQSLIDDASAFARSVGSDEMQNLRSSQSTGAEKNKARDLRRRLLKTSRWPPIYVENVRFWSVKQKEMVSRPLAFLLPHEILAILAEHGDQTVLCESEALDGSNTARHGHIREKLGPFVSLSLWGDGIPFSWDRKKSADIWTLSFPGVQQKALRDVRIVLTAMPHEAVVRESQDDVMSILAWSLAALARGSFPTTRHDGEEWTADDTWRKKKSGAPVIRAAVLEMKGDWKQLHSCFTVPYWARKAEAPICWRCDASKQSMRTDFGRAAPWLQADHRLSSLQCLQRILDDGGDLSPAFSIPFFTMDHLRIDWLHCADQGVTPVFMGGLFHMLLEDKGYGRNQDARCARLWEEIQAWYEATAVQDRLHNLTVSMIKPKKGPIELTGSGAQIRSLVPFGRMLVESWPEPLEVEAYAAKNAMTHLAKCYDQLSAILQPQREGLLDNALAFHQSLVGLHAVNSKRWQLRPKLHMFLELCAEPGPPSSSWNYREESFGGSVSHQCHRRGGFATPLAMSRGALTKFCSKEALPRFVA